ncbi:MAG: TIGR04282 family arsenosugar biosynthesis glycosyltransferase [Deltaproteobacteria bacterium]|nr:TIGR04282 family arsenosugar biosynthesis glycosyltransferase [Deltaproteobacteria bacterium]
MKGSDTLILMCKAPIPGTVKTRLCPPLSRRQAAALYACFLEDTAGEAASLRRIRRRLCYAPPEAKAYFLAAPFSGFLPREQKGNGLGERMAHAMEEAFSEGARRVAIVGGDCPALSAERIRSAFRELSDGADAVFGPSEDGGFYLIGLSAPSPFLFPGIEWSTGTVLTEILSRCRNAGMTYALLPAESDVDTAEDLAALRRWTRARTRPPCPRTRGWIASYPPTERTTSSRGEERASSPSPGRRLRSGERSPSGPARGPRSRTGRSPR